MLGDEGVERAVGIEVPDPDLRRFELRRADVGPEGIAVAPGLVERPAAVEIGVPLAHRVERRETAAVDETGVLEAGAPALDRALAD